MGRAVEVSVEKVVNGIGFGGDVPVISGSDGGEEIGDRQGY